MNERLDDLWLRTMTSAPQPKLSTNFDSRLAIRMCYRRLNAKDLWVICIYAAASIVVTVWSMRLESIPWLLIVASVLLPLILIGIIFGNIRRAFQSLVQKIHTLAGFKSRRTKNCT